MPARSRSIPGSVTRSSRGRATIPTFSLPSASTASTRADEAARLLAGACGGDGTGTCQVDAGLDLDPVVHRCQSPEGR